jgi:hypothetical protein
VNNNPRLLLPAENEMLDAASYYEDRLPVWVRTFCIRSDTRHTGYRENSFNNAYTTFHYPGLYKTSHFASRDISALEKAAQRIAGDVNSWRLVS